MDVSPVSKHDESKAVLLSSDVDASAEYEGALSHQLCSNHHLLIPKYLQALLSAESEIPNLAAASRWLY